MTNPKTIRVDVETRDQLLNKVLETARQERNAVRSGSPVGGGGKSLGGVGTN